MRWRGGVWPTINGLSRLINSPTSEHHDDNDDNDNDHDDDDDSDDDEDYYHILLEPSSGFCKGSTFRRKRRHSAPDQLL